MLLCQRPHTSCRIFWKAWPHFPQNAKAPRKCSVWKNMPPHFRLLRRHFNRVCLAPLLASGRLVMTIPDKVDFWCWQNGRDDLNFIQALPAPLCLDFNSYCEVCQAIGLPKSKNSTFEKLKIIRRFHLTRPAFCKWKTFSSGCLWKQMCCKSRENILCQVQMDWVWNLNGTNTKTN